MTFPAKRLRAQYIALYVRQAGYRGVVAFSCGNATAALRDAGLWVLDVSPHGDLAPTDRWWQPWQVHAAFPDLFDATPGHLPAWMMYELGRVYRRHIGDLPEQVDVPTGSGETILCLRWAYPMTVFTPVYTVGVGTEYSPNALLNGAVAAGGLYPMEVEK